MAQRKPMHPVVAQASAEELLELRLQIRRRLDQLSGRGRVWDDAMEERLRFLWLKTGRSLRRVADDLDLTPGQVAGKLRRLGLMGAARPFT